MRVSRNVGVTSSLGLAFILHLSSSIFLKKKKNLTVGRQPIAYLLRSITILYFLPRIYFV